MRIGNYDRRRSRPSWREIQTDIDTIAFDLYGFSEADRAAALASFGLVRRAMRRDRSRRRKRRRRRCTAIEQIDGLLSWSVGVLSAGSTGDWPLANAKPHPSRSHSTLCQQKAPACFLMMRAVSHPFRHSCRRTGHPHDLARLMEEVLARVDAPVLPNVRRWLQCDFFPFHLDTTARAAARPQSTGRYRPLGQLYALALLPQR